MPFMWHEYVYLKLKVEDSYFDGTKVRLYVPQNKDDRRAGILFVHGGGWMICSIGKALSVYIVLILVAFGTKVFRIDGRVQNHSC